jgi:HJR/Mrr/RecB family endonuclease
MLCASKGLNLTNRQLVNIIWDRLIKGDYESFQSNNKGDIDRMNGVQFEVFLGNFFHRCGYQVEKTPESYDMGADLILYRDGLKSVVQAKRSKRSIGVKAVREIYSAQNYYQAHKAMVVTSSNFTKSAIILADVHNVELWDRQRLKKELNAYNIEF